MVDFFKIDFFWSALDKVHILPVKGWLQQAGEKSWSNVMIVMFLATIGAFY